MAGKTETEKMVSNVQDISERQQAVYQQAADNFLAFQRRSMDFAQDGLKLMEMSQSNFKAAQKWWADGFRLARRQQETVRFAGEWMSGGLNAVQNQADQNIGVYEEMAENVRRQQESMQSFTDAWINSYQSFVAPFVEQAEKNVETAKRATRSGR